MSAFAKVDARACEDLDEDDAALDWSTATCDRLESTARKHNHCSCSNGALAAEIFRCDIVAQ